MNFFNNIKKFKKHLWTTLFVIWVKSHSNDTPHNKYFASFKNWSKELIITESNFDFEVFVSLKKNVEKKTSESFPLRGIIYN